MQMNMLTKLQDRKITPLVEKKNKNRQENTAWDPDVDAYCLLTPKPL